MVSRAGVAEAVKPLAVASLLALAIAAPAWGQVSPRVLSLDQCADQFVLALSPRNRIVGLSPRARNADSWLAARAAGLPIHRVDSESALAARPEVVIRYWGGDPNLLADLRRRGARVVTIADATTFTGVRENIRLVAAALGEVSTGEALVRRMNAQLLASEGAWRGAPALYLTSGGATAGGGTLIDAIMRAAGLRNLTRGAGYRAISLERLQLDPPQAVVKGFFDAPAQARVRWGPGRHGALAQVTTGRELVSLPGALLGCPAWFAGDAVAALAAAAPRAAARTSAPVS